MSDKKTSTNEKDLPTTMEENAELLIRDEKSCDSDTNSEYHSCNDDQNVVISNNSPFYESSDSKIDYAVKLDDNDTLSDIDDIKTDTASADSEDSALGSLPSETGLNDKEEDVQRSDGSDSGFGSEVPDEAKLPSFSLVLPNDLGTILTKSEEININPLPINENEDNTDHTTIVETAKPCRSSLKRHHDNHEDEPLSKRKKHNIQFDNVTVFYFPRAQGFSCVPSQGGSTLGMEWEHSHTQRFTLAEHALEQKRLHRQILQQLKNERHSLQGTSLSSSEDSDTEEEASDISESELDLDSYYFLQPVPTRQRRALLRAAGVRKIEGYEKDECRDIRTSREFCGCACKGVCNPDNCSCSLAGIKCQVDRLNFPCGCTRDGCGNTTGRIEFNPMRVRTHFINTLMRVGLEKKNEESQEAAKRKWAEIQIANNPSTCITNSFEKNNCHNHQELSVSNSNLLPRLSVESGINSGNYEMFHSLNNPNSQSDTAYNFQNDTVNHSNLNKSDHRNHDPYTSNILQGKGPPYSTANSMEFNSVPNNLQRYPCDLNYTYDQVHLENHHFKSLQNISASSFEEFAHNSHMSMFNQYGHMYDYIHKPTTSMSEHNPLHYQAMPQNNYAMYKESTECVNNDNKNESHYTTLITMPYQQNNKYQAIENDENWFSHNTLLNLDHSVQVGQEAAIQSEQVQASEDTSDATENFGELIKKTMVESVTV